MYRFKLTIVVRLICLLGLLYLLVGAFPILSQDASLYDDPLKSHVFLNLGYLGSGLEVEGGADYRFLAPFRIGTEFNLLGEEYSFLVLQPGLSWRYFDAVVGPAFVFSPESVVEPYFSLRVGERDGFHLSGRALGLFDESGAIAPKLFGGGMGLNITQGGVLGLSYTFGDFDRKVEGHERDTLLVSFRDEIISDISLHVAGGASILKEVDFPSYNFLLGLTYNFNHGFDVAGLNFGDLWSQPTEISRGEGDEENLLEQALLPPGITYITSTVRRSYVDETDWHEVEKVYEDVPYLSASLGAGFMGLGLNAETSLDYKLGGPYRVEIGMGTSQGDGGLYYPFLFRPSYSFGLFPFLPAGDWKYFQFGLGLTGGFFSGGGRVVPIPFPALLLRVGAEDSLYAFLDVGDVPYTSGGISGSALGLGWGITPATRIALMAGVPSFTDILDLSGLNVPAISAYPQVSIQPRPMALLSWEQGLADLDEFVGRIGLTENLFLQLGGGVFLSDFSGGSLSGMAPIITLGLSYNTEFPSADVGASELLRAAEVLEKEERWGEAGETYRKIISRFPDNRWIDEAVYKNALSYEKMGEAEEALREYTFLAANYPTSRWNALAQYALGARAVRDAHWDVVYKSFTNVLNSQPGSGIARRSSYWAEYSLAKLEDRQRSEILLEEFLIFFPDVELSDDALFRLGESFYEEGRYPEAIERYTEIVVNYPDSDKAGPAQLMLGHSLYRTQELGQAEEEYRKVIQNFSDREELIKEAQAGLDKLKTEIGQ